MSNLFAVFHRDPRWLRRIESQLRSTGDFDQVWLYESGWVAAHAALPEGEPDGEAVRAKGLMFLEGRDCLEHGAGPRWLDRVIELTDHAPGRLDELPGDFAFVRFRADRTVAAVRSCAGLVPLYVHRSSDGLVALGTLLSYFPRFLPGTFDLDPLINAAFHLDPEFIDGRTFIEGVRILPPASHTELAPDHDARTTVYWDPRPSEGHVPAPSNEHAIELRSVLIKVLERDLDPTGRNLLSLSGGVDSSSLAALVGGVIGNELSSISVIPANEPHRSHERSFIDEIVTQFNIEPAYTVDFTAQSIARWASQHRGLPFDAGHPSLGELPSICERQDVRVLLGGELADDVCGHWPRFGDWVRHTDAMTVLRTPPRNLPRGPKDYVRWVKWRTFEAVGRPMMAGPRRLYSWAHEDLQEEFHEWLASRRHDARKDRRPLRDLARAMCNDGWVAMNWEGTTPLGVRRSLPFCNREVLELAFRCHPADLLGPGPKRLLRVALSGDVPPRNLFRPDKGVSSNPLEAKKAFEFLPSRMPKGAERIIRSDWLPTPPARVDADLVQLLGPLSVARWLEDRSRPGHASNG